VAVCDCTPVDSFFDPRKAGRELKKFRKRGASRRTREMLAAIEKASLPPGPTLLDIGGGVGAIHHDLLNRGFSHATQIDAAKAYLDVAKVEAERLGHVGRVSFLHGSFHDLVETAPEVDVVTLDRVVCCDPDVRSMLGGAASRARCLVGFTYPRPRVVVRAMIAVLNLFEQTFGKGFRAYVHSPHEMAAVLEHNGLKRHWAGGTWMWAAEVFER
jgi:magnesium-protoporphyrin O-methyltransferase